MPLRGSLPCGKEACITQGSCEPCHSGPTTTDGFKQRVLIKHDPLEEGMANHPSMLAWRTSWTVQKAKRINNTRRWASSSEGVQYAPGEEWRRITNSPSMNEVAGPKRIWHSVVDVVMKVKSMLQRTYYIGTWCARSMNPRKLNVGKQEMVRINTSWMQSSRE